MAVCAFLQNYLTDVALPKRRAGAYVGTQVISLGLAMVVLFGMFGRGVFMLPVEMAVGLAVGGAINVLGMMLYFKALRNGETMEVTVFGQSSPLIALALGVVILGERVSVMQGLAFALIMGAALLLVFATKSKKGRAVNLKVAGVAFLSAFFWVLSDVIFVWFAGDGGMNFDYFGQTFFYYELGGFVAILVALACMPSWRKALRAAFLGRGNVKNATVMLLDNGIFTVAEFLFKFGLMAAPAVALMSVVAHVSQLGITFVLGVFLMRFFPSFAREKYSRKVVMHHLVAGVMVGVGIVLLG